MSIVKCHESHYVGVLDNPRNCLCLFSFFFFSLKVNRSVKTP